MDWRPLGQAPDVNAKGRDGRTPLLHAASSRNGRTEIVELLIAEGADVNAKNSAGLITPLDSANYAKRHPETADLFRKHGGKTGEELKAAGN
ncbi:MAG TPA: hypothetical protein DCO70_09190 [Verrucomicrobiales bacterium]|nr:hypothetical protein [Verrucomicrobiales bacterium]